MTAVDKPPLVRQDPGMARRVERWIFPWYPLVLMLASCESLATPDHGAQRFRVAVCQLEVDSKPAVNLGRIETALAKAAALGADLACFPEACVFGWVNPMAHEGAASISGPTTRHIGALAARHQLMVVLGLAEREGDQLYNSVVLIDTDGQVLLRHRKVNVLAKLMQPPYTPGPGAEQSVVDTRLGRIGLLICADTFRASLVDRLAAQNPDIIIVPYGWAAPADAWPDHGKSLLAWVANTARRCGAPVVGIDSTGKLHHGPWKNHLLGGQSVVCDAAGEVLGVLADRRPELRVFDFARSNAGEAR